METVYHWGHSHWLRAIIQSVIHFWGGFKTSWVKALITFGVWPKPSLPRHMQHGLRASRNNGSLSMLNSNNENTITHHSNHSTIT
eukprot:1391928-Amorphochlora_amoeboformis.AAC.2